MLNYCIAFSIHIWFFVSARLILQFEHIHEFEIICKIFFKMFLIKKHL